MEILPRFHDLDIAPARFDQRFASGGNGGVLRAPELIAVGEIAVLAEQVGDDPALVITKRKDRGLGRYRRAAEQPRLQLRAGRRIGLRVVEQIGRASCRGRVCQYVEISVVAVSIKKKIIKTVYQSQSLYTTPIIDAYE